MGSTRALLAGIVGLSCLTAATLDLRSEITSPFLDRTVIVAGEPRRYKVFVPADYQPARRFPIILFLHGAGERGTDGLAHTAVGLGNVLRTAPTRYPAIVVFPQASPGARWTGTEAGFALAALARTEREFYTDPERVYLTGLSMGGSGAWYVAYRNPGRFAALLVVCARLTPAAEAAEPIVPPEDGRVYDALAKRLKGTPAWMFHGDQDDVVPVDESRQMYAALRSAGASVRYTELAGVGHDAWNAAYESREVADWMFSQRINVLHAPPTVW